MRTWSDIKAVAETVLPPRQETPTGSENRLLSSEEMKVIFRLEELYEAFRSGDAEALVSALELVYPAWIHQVDHTRYVGSKTDQTLEDRFYLLHIHNHRFLVTFTKILSTFLALAKDQDDATVDRWLDRIRRTIELTGSHYAVNHRVYTASFDMEDIVELQAHRNVYVLSAIKGLEEGFTVDEMIKTGPYFYQTGYLHYTPENLRLLRKSYTYKEIKSLVTVCSSLKSMDDPPFEDFLAVLDAGFANGADFKTFVKNLRYEYSEPNLFRKAVNAAHSLSPEDVAVLKNKNSTAAAVAAVIVKM